jgi:adenosylmethionine-8-amino-7-oxononanoate aminotransferase
LYTLIEAIVQQARKFAFAHTVFFTSDPAEELAQILISQSEGSFTKVMFVSSGNLRITCLIRCAKAIADL